MLGHFRRQVAHRHRQRALGNRVDAAPRVGLVHPEGGDHDDGPGVLRLHLRQHRAAQVQRADQVDVEGLLHLLVGAAFQGVEPAVGVGAVDQRIDAPESLDGGLGEGLAGVGVADVGGHPEYLAAGLDGADAFFRLAQARFVAGADRHGAGAFAGGLQGELDAHAGADAGNHHNLVSEQHGSVPLVVIDPLCRSELARERDFAFASKLAPTQARNPCQPGHARWRARYSP
ncbi:hypothetical protein D3C84_505580 [compost metagenome]